MGECWARSREEQKNDRIDLANRPKGVPRTLEFWSHHWKFFYIIKVFIYIFYIYTLHIYIFYINYFYKVGFPWWLNGKQSACQCRRHRFDPWVEEIPWRRKWQHTPVFLPGKYHGQRSLVGYSPWGCKRVGHDLASNQQQFTLDINNICLWAKPFCFENSGKYLNSKFYFQTAVDVDAASNSLQVYQISFS